MMGELHPRLQQQYELPKPPIVFELDLAPLLARPLPRHGELSKFHPVRRDISVTVADSEQVGAMIDAVYALARTERRLPFLHEFQVFDVYRAPPNSSKSRKRALTCC